MLKIEKFVTPSPEQWEITIEGMRNAMNSWDKSDSGLGCTSRNAWGKEETGLKLCKSCSATYDSKCVCAGTPAYCIGPNDLDLMLRLNNGGAPHAKYRRMLPVHVTVNAPLYWWKEFETYRIGVASNPSDIEFNSCSTMHKIHAKEFVLEDFSVERLMPHPSMEAFTAVINALNCARELYLECESPEFKKDWWYNMIQLLPSSYNQKRTIYLNYQVLYEIYEWRRNHKLDEWHTFCHWIEELPYSELIIGEKE